MRVPLSSVLTLSIRQLLSGLEFPLCRGLNNYLHYFVCLGGFLIIIMVIVQYTIEPYSNFEGPYSKLHRSSQPPRLQKRSVGTTKVVLLNRYPQAGGALIQRTPQGPSSKELPDQRFLLVLTRSHKDLLMKAFAPKCVSVLKGSWDLASSVINKVTIFF